MHIIIQFFLLDRVPNIEEHNYENRPGKLKHLLYMHIYKASKIPLIMEQVPSKVDGWMCLSGLSIIQNELKALEQSPSLSSVELAQAD